MEFTMSDKTPAADLSNFPPLLQSALALLALELIDATKDDRNEAWAWAMVLSCNESFPPYVRLMMERLQGVAAAVQAQAAQNRATIPHVLHTRCILGFRAHRTAPRLRFGGPFGGRGDSESGHRLG